MNATTQPPESHVLSAPVPRAHGTLLLAATVVAWLVLLAGAILAAQRITVTGPAGMSFPRATFFIVNAASLTGFEMTWASPDTLTLPHATLWLLGVGLTSLLSVSIATAAMVRASEWDWGPGRIVLTAAGFLAGLWVASFLAEASGGMGWNTAAWNASMVATGTGLLAGAPEPSFLWYARYPLAAIAAVGPFVLLDSFSRGRVTRQSQVVGIALPVAFLLSVAAMVAAQSLPGDPLVPAATAAVDAVGAGGAGFSHDTVSLSPPARWTLIPVLLLGGVSGGIGGGLKAVTAAVLVIGLARLLRRGAGSVGTTFAIAAIWLVGLAVLFGVTFVLLLHTSPQLRPDRAALLAAAACGNCGIGIDPVTVAGNDAYVLAAAMLLGRALPWGVLWWSATRGDEPLAVG